MLLHLSSMDNKDRAAELIKNEGLESISYYDTEGDFTKNYQIVGVPTAFYLNSDHVLDQIIRGPEDIDTILEKLGN